MIGIKQNKNFIDLMAFFHLKVEMSIALFIGIFVDFLVFSKLVMLKL